MPVKAVTFDAYGTLLRNEDLLQVSRRIVDDHRLAAPIDSVFRSWIELYHEETQRPPFRTLRELQEDVFRRLLHECGVAAEADPAPYVDLFFQVTTKVELYPEALAVLILISEAVRAYKPDRVVFERALERFGVEPHEVLHVGDSDVDDVKGAKSTGLLVAWLNRDGRPRRPGVPPPDFEIRDLTELPALVR